MNSILGDATDAAAAPAFGASSWANGDFRKDLAAAQLRALPFDGMVNEVSMFSVRFETARASLNERLRLAAYLRADYVRPRWWFARHSWRGHRDARRNWRPGQARLAAIVAVNRAIAGHTSATWLNDPQLAHVTPHLAEKAAGYVAMGGRRFRGVTSAETAGFALQTSASRRKLHAEGGYDPQSYWVAIARRDLLRWGRREWQREAPDG